MYSNNSVITKTHRLDVSLRAYTVYLLYTDTDIYSQASYKEKVKKKHIMVYYFKRYVILKRSISCVQQKFKTNDDDVAIAQFERTFDLYGKR